MGPSVGGRDLDGLAAEVALEAILLAHVAGAAVDAVEAAVAGETGRPDLERQAAAVAMDEIEAGRDRRAGNGRRLLPAAAGELEGALVDENAEVAPDHLVARPAEERSAVSLRYVNVPSAAVEKIASGELSTRNR